MGRDKPTIREQDRIDLHHDYAVCAWARLFNVSEHKVREAVAAVGDKAVRVRDHLRPEAAPQRGREPARSSERPSGA